MSEQTNSVYFFFGFAPQLKATATATQLPKLQLVDAERHWKKKKWKKAAKIAGATRQLVWLHLSPLARLGSQLGQSGTKPKPHCDH